MYPIQIYYELCKHIIVEPSSVFDIFTEAIVDAKFPI